MTQNNIDLFHTTKELGDIIHVIAHKKNTSNQIIVEDTSEKTIIHIYGINITANEKIISNLAKALDKSKSAFLLKSGHKTKSKKFIVQKQLFN